MITPILTSQGKFLRQFRTSQDTTCQWAFHPQISWCQLRQGWAERVQSFVASRVFQKAVIQELHCAVNQAGEQERPQRARLENQ